jgi:7-cyano-7-deazaguanine synthase
VVGDYDMTKKKQAIVLLSGGLDSATCCAIARADGFDLIALSFAYGQRHRVELKAAERVARFFSVKDHLIISINAPVFGASALTSAAAVPKNRDLDAAGPEIPSTYVPARNTIFLGYALAYAEITGSRDIFIGVNALDYSGYPDCRPEFIRAFETMANLATKAGVEGKKTTIHAPLGTLTKAQIIRKGTELGVDYGMTHSCYDPSPSGLACGSCDSCRLRMKGFAEAGVKDPTAYELFRLTD